MNFARVIAVCFSLCFCSVCALGFVTSAKPAVYDEYEEIEELIREKEFMRVFLAGDVLFTLSFAGDCTLGTDYGRQGSSFSFVSVVKSDYGYPFAYAKEEFLTDDFTLVNLEGTLTDQTRPRPKTFRFKGPVQYANILVNAGIEAVTLTNNHAMDYGEAGYEDTKSSLSACGVAFAGFEEGLLFRTKRGLMVGVLGVYASRSREEDITNGIAQLKERGAQFVVAAFHWGTEHVYRENARQQAFARVAIDAGADMVVGHHPHVLQPVTFYKGKSIAYSLGNFSFGGNFNPSDRDTVILQQEVIRKRNGRIVLGRTTAIPYAISGCAQRNDYRPVPYPVYSAGYRRVLQKLGL